MYLEQFVQVMLKKTDLTRDEIMSLSITDAKKYVKEILDKDLIIFLEKDY